jgi:hypothetical protein
MKGHEIDRPQRLWLIYARRRSKGAG